MTKPVERIHLPCGCGGRYPVVCSAENIGKTISCPWSSQPMRVGGGRQFGEVQWAECGDVRVVHSAFDTLGHRLSGRKVRLFTCALARAVAPADSEVWVHHAIDAGEVMADGASPPIRPEFIRQHLPDCLARSCLDSHASTLWTGIPFPDAPAAGIYRDLVPNPFIPLSWNSDWFTSTVRELAAHIYNRREFSTMPILAGALQDAGCEDEQILNHCRAEKPHARGCWVLDAILGKT
jgi:hypothetical protein